MGAVSCSALASEDFFLAAVGLTFDPGAVSALISPFTPLSPSHFHHLGAHCPPGTFAWRE